MPLIDVTCSHRVETESRGLLVAQLPHIVSEAVACGSEPYDGNLRPGDVVLRFHEVSPGDRFDIDVLIEVRSKWTEERVANRQERAEHIHREVVAMLGSSMLGSPMVVGVFLTLPIAAWAQNDEGVP
jgi:hypothetical protein